jgi:predicted DNA-binding protein
MLAFKTTAEVKEAMEHLANSHDKTLSTYLHEVIFKHYCELMQSEAVEEAKTTGKMTLGYLLHAVKKMQ